MKNIIFLGLLLSIISCDSDDFEPKMNEFGTQILLMDDSRILSQTYFVFTSITAKDTPYDFNDDGNTSFDILAQFPECAADDPYRFQDAAFSIFGENDCEPGINPLENFDEYFIGNISESKTRFRLVILQSEAATQRIEIREFELYENEEGKRTIIGEWTSFDPAFVFDVVMTEIDRPEL